jgi:uncharacterized protein (TIGR02147 family)
MDSIFEGNDYKVYLRERMIARASRGDRNRLAAAIRCHNGYISQVLNGDAHFSLEQAELINPFFGHTKAESDYFLLMIQFARAGTASLRKHFQEQMKSLSEKRFLLKDRLKFKKILSKEDQATFYSSWYYGAIHVLVSVPRCSTAQGIAEYLALPLDRVRETLEFLLSVNLVTLTNGRYQIGTSHIHLGSDSPMISKHHTNWRLQAMRSLDLQKKEDMHYSSVMTVSLEDSVKVRELLVKAIEDIRAVIRNSDNEACFAYAIDFFGLKHSATKIAGD